MKGPTLGLSQQVAEAEGSLTREAPGRAGAALTTPGRLGTTRRVGPGKQDGTVYECRNQRWNPLKRNAPAQTWWIWAGQQCTLAGSHGGRLLVGQGSCLQEATVKACGVAVARLQGKSWAPPPSTG